MLHAVLLKQDQEGLRSEMKFLLCTCGLSGVDTWMTESTRYLVAT